MGVWPSQPVSLQENGGRSVSQTFNQPPGQYSLESAVPTGSHWGGDLGWGVAGQSGWALT